MSGFTYKYNKTTREYQVVKDGIASAWFNHLRDCKLSWKFMVGLINAEIVVEV